MGAQALGFGLGGVGVDISYLVQLLAVLARVRPTLETSHHYPTSPHIPPPFLQLSLVGGLSVKALSVRETDTR